jgi:hypothetical protein
MCADAPENQAEFVFRVIRNGQPAQQHEAAPVLDLPEDFLDYRAQRKHLKMLALQHGRLRRSRPLPPQRQIAVDRPGTISRKGAAEPSILH